MRSLTIHHDTNSMNCNGFPGNSHSHWCGIYYICHEVNQVCKDRKESAAQGVLIDKRGNKWLFIICLVCKRANYGLTDIACSVLNNISVVTEWPYLSAPLIAKIGYWACHKFNVCRRFSLRASFTSGQHPLHLFQGRLGMRESEGMCWLARECTNLPITVPAAGVQSWPTNMWRKRKLYHIHIVPLTYINLRSPEECSALCHRDSSLAFQYDSGVTMTLTIYVSLLPTIIYHNRPKSASPPRPLSPWGWITPPMDCPPTYRSLILLACWEPLMCRYFMKYFGDFRRENYSCNWRARSFCVWCQLKHISSFGGHSEPPDCVCELGCWVREKLN